MKSMLALIKREYIEHRGAFVIAPLILTALVFGAILLGFTVGRVDVRFSGSVFQLSPTLIYERAFLVLGFAWSLYLAGALFFYGAGSFSADSRNNAMLFWKSMPVSDLRIMVAKFIAGLTVLPASILGFALLSGLLVLTVMSVTMAMTGAAIGSVLPMLLSGFGKVAAALALAMVTQLLWYLPVLALVSAMATLVGRWAVPVTALVPLMVSILEWVAFGGLSPFHTASWAYLSSRLETLLPESYLEQWFIDESASFSLGRFTSELLMQIDWAQMLVGWLLAAVLVYAASEYRRRYVLT
ncbi:ABC transporter permease [Devosia pacifica]|uniref:ABC transporter permease n=1 Tax=Devosia pacifica TaxID=1335967 RepID=A0A918VSS7_9HYPH|nr:hypothetical protein [Devosia pacifica]GHA21035.1 ABC transporter permease [Devosia pacifica]